MGCQLAHLAPQLGLNLPQLPPAAIDFLDPRPRVAYFFEPLALPVAEEMAA